MLSNYCKDFSRDILASDTCTRM